MARQTLSVCLSVCLSVSMILVFFSFNINESSTRARARSLLNLSSISYYLREQRGFWFHLAEFAYFLQVHLVLHLEVRISLLFSNALFCPKKLKIRSA